MSNRDRDARDLRCLLLSELAAAQRPLTTAQLRRRINERRETELVLETIYRNLCVLRDRHQIRRAGRAGRHTLWVPTPDSRPADASIPTPPEAKSHTAARAELSLPSNYPQQQRKTMMPPVLTPEVRTLIDAANIGDTDAFLAAFAPRRGVVDDWGRRFHGSEEIRHWSNSEFIGKRVTLKLIHFYFTGDAEVVVIAQVGGDGFNGPSTFTFRVAENKVTEMRITA
jgi:hypothetical protein